jgi:hypothetical protein
MHYGPTSRFFPHHVKANEVLEKCVVEKERSMSRFLNKLITNHDEKQRLGYVKAPLNYAELTSDVMEVRPIEYVNIKYTLKLGTSFAVKLPIETEEMSIKREYAYRSIAEEVYGEFRPALYKLQEAILTNDWKTALRLTNVIYEGMFTNEDMSLHPDISKSCSG